MAILNGLINKMKGSAGQLTFKRLNGQTVVSERPTKISNPRTEAQQRQRTRWTNIIRMYKGLMPLLRDAFEKKLQTQSDYNMFVKLNNQGVRVYLTKQQADGGACIAAPYQLTQGSLPSIVIAGEGAGAKTDIALGGLTISASTTVGEFAKAVVDNNADYNYGDQISFYNVLQLVNATTEIPYCNFSASYVVLDKASTAKLWEVASKEGFASAGGVLAHGTDDSDSVFAWVHSRKESGKTKVSTQFLIDNNSMLPDFISEDAYQGAAESYGGTNSIFLRPDGTVVTGGNTGNTENSGGSSSGSSDSGSDSGGGSVNPGTGDMEP